MINYSAQNPIRVFMNPQNQPPLVSVITPSYNREDLIPETIESVLSQDYPNFEYIVLDDGSADDTQSVLDGYDDSRMRWEAHPNMGEARTVNKGFKLAKGKYVVIVNSDDPLLPGHLKTCVEFMENHDDILVGYPDWIMIDENSQPTKTILVEEYSYERLFGQFFCLPGPGAIIRLSAIKAEGDRDPSFRFTGDYQYWLRLGLHGDFARIPGTFASHRVHAGGLTSQYFASGMDSEYIALIDVTLEHPKITEVEKSLASKAYGSAYYTLGRISVANDPKKAAYYFWKSILICPMNCLPQGQPRSWRLMSYYILARYLPSPIKYPLSKIFRLVQRLRAL